MPIAGQVEFLLAQSDAGESALWQWGLGCTGAAEPSLNSTRRIVTPFRRAMPKRLVEKRCLAIALRTPVLAMGCAMA
jgi:hypothetical protein